MINFFDYLLYRIIKLFGHEYLLIIWLITFNVLNYCLFIYQRSINQELDFDLIDLIIICFFIITFYRAKWIAMKLR